MGNTLSVDSSHRFRYHHAKTVIWLPLRPTVRHLGQEMLGKLIQKVIRSIGVHRLKQLPAIQDGLQAIETYWTGNREMTKDFSEEFVERQAEMMMEEVIKVATSPNPRMANREKLTNCVIEYAKFQVLVIDPPPAEDPTGLRGQPGISGELKAHLVELSQKDKTLREFMHALDTPKDWDDVWNPIVLGYRRAWAWMHVFNALRRAFDDVNRAEGKDWLKPYLAAMCAWEEHQYRSCLGMPSSLNDSGIDADLRALVMGGFMNRVMEGVRYPDLEWRERMQKFERRHEDTSA